jgi:zinc-ribbon domain
MAVATGQYCGRCGAPLLPGAHYCGRCGTPVMTQAYAAPPAYRYAPAPQATYPTPGQPKLAPAFIAGGLVLVLMVVAVAVGVLSLARAASGQHGTCTFNCPPKSVTPLPEQASFTSSAYRFTVNYSSKWTVRDRGPASITLGTHLGSVQVTGSTGQSPDQALQATVRSLPSSQWQDVTQVRQLRGAHLGDVDGVGAIYSANLVGSGQTASKTRIAVIAASKGGVTVVVLATDPADPKGSPNGFPEGQQIDYMCTEFAWG